MTTIHTSDVLDAYRADLDQARTSALSDADAAWIALGIALQRAAGLSPSQRVDYLRNALSSIEATGRIRPPADGARPIGTESDLDELLFETVHYVSSSAEDCGAFAVAMVFLDYGRSLINASDVNRQGRLVYQQARVLRKVGDLDRSDEILHDLLESAAANDRDALVCWAKLGLGVNARVRGNYPSAREAFQSVLACPVSAPDGAQLHVHAHHGLLVTCAAAGDFASAISHGVAALRATIDPTGRLELLVNLAAVCSDTGNYRASLNAYLRALAESPSQRIYVGALGGAMLAAGKLGDTRAVRELGRKGESLLLRDSPAYELADMTREMAEAHRLIGDLDDYERLREHAVLRAKQGQFFEVLHRIECLEKDSVMLQDFVRSVPEAPAAAEEIAAGDSHELLLAAVSSDLPDSYSR
jgi:tetratricopeptide (TPR) repeat protein